MPDSQPFKKKKISRVWLLNFILPGFGLGTIYACGTGCMGILFWVWLLECFFMRLDVLLFMTVAMSIWGTVEVARLNQAVDFEEELDAARTLPGTIAAVDNLIDHVSKGLVSAIEDDDQTVYALDTLEKKAREAELRLRSIEAKLNTQSKDQADDVTGAALDKLPEALGADPLSLSATGAGNLDKPAAAPGIAASGLMSFAPLFETVEDQDGISLPLGKEPVPLPISRSPYPSGAEQAISFEPHHFEDDNQNEEAIRAWLDTRGGATQAYTVPATPAVEKAPAEPEDAPVAALPNQPIFVVGAPEFDEPAPPEVTLETRGLNDDVALETGGLSSEGAFGTPEFNNVDAPETVTLSDLMEPLESSEIGKAVEPEFALQSSEITTPAEREFVLESTVSENVAPTVPFESSFKSELEEVPSTLSVAGLDTPFEATSMSNGTTSLSTGTTGFVPGFEPSATDYADFLSEKDRKVTDFVDKLANTIGSASAPQPTIDSAFEFSLPTFESSFSFDFSNALADGTEKDKSYEANAASKSSKHCQRCGSDRQSDFSFCLKCGISF